MSFQYIKNKSWVTGIIKERNLVMILVAAGLISQAFFTVILATVDERGVLVKLCKHIPADHLDLIYSFKKVPFVSNYSNVLQPTRGA